jgi:hypothetical protein
MANSNGEGGPNPYHTRQIGQRCACCGTMTVGILEPSVFAGRDGYNFIEVTTSGAGDDVADVNLISEKPNRPPATICLTRSDLEELTEMVLAATSGEDDT